MARLTRTKQITVRKSPQTDGHQPPGWMPVRERKVVTAPPKSIEESAAGAEARFQKKAARMVGAITSRPPEAILAITAIIPGCNQAKPIHKSRSARMVSLPTQVSEVSDILGLICLAISLDTIDETL